MRRPSPHRNRLWPALLSLACSALPAGAAKNITDPNARIPVSAAGLQPHDTTGWSPMGGGAANIEYTLPKAGRVRVRVFDASGREIARPVDEWQAAGVHMTMFAFGPSTKTQVYRYRVECGTRKRSGKVVIEP